MIERTLITTRGKLRVSIPSQLNEVTLVQMINIAVNKSDKRQAIINYN
ncbi:hypothetical protein [Mucilaginibacter phyllosphaerae]|nr:hypothetical protein [Mucilaginibacter phyllosphaerae]